MKCNHTGDLTQLPEAVMDQKCQHSYHCPVCEYDWPCSIKDCHGFPREMAESLQNELETLLEGIEW